MLQENTKALSQGAGLNPLNYSNIFDSLSTVGGVLECLADSKVIVIK